MKERRSDVHGGTRLGVTLIVLAVLFLSLGDAVIKGVSASLSLWQVYVVRGAIALPILFALLIVAGRRHGLWPTSWRWVLLRSTLIASMWIAYYAALPLMSLSLAAAALYTAPLFIAIFSSVLLREAIGRVRWFGVAVGFAGVLVMLRPDTGAFSFVAFLPVLAASLYALAGIVTRNKCRDEHPMVMALNLNLVMFIIGVVATTYVSRRGGVESDGLTHPFLQRPWTTMEPPTWAAMVLLALIVVGVSPAVAKAYQTGPPVTIGTSENAYLVFAALWSIAFFAEPPDAATVAGMLLIVMAGWLVTRPTELPSEEHAP